MKYNHPILKLIILITAGVLLMNIVSCKKQTVCEVGDTCLVKKHIFDKDVYQPSGSVEAIKKHTDYWNRQWLDCKDTQGAIWYFEQKDLYKIGE